MAALGFSLNLLTLLAMVLAIGLVVDDAIVVVENVYRHIEQGRTPAQAALIGAREIAGPVIAMTLTLAAVYAPIGFLGGVTGALFREFAFTLAGAVIISGIVAVTLSPMMCSLLLSREMLRGRFVRVIDRIFHAVADWYGRKLAALARLPSGDRAVWRCRVRQHRLHVFEHLGRARPRRGPGRALRADQGAAIFEPRLRQFLQRQARPGVYLVSRDLSALYRQRPVRAEPGHRRHHPEAMERAHPFVKAVEAAAAAKGERGRRALCLCLQPAAAAGDDRRLADPDGDLFAERLQVDLPRNGEDQGGGAKERAVHCRRQRPRLQPAGDPCRRSTARRRTNSASRCNRSATPWRCWSAKTTSTASISAAAPTR